MWAMYVYVCVFERVLGGGGAIQTTKVPSSKTPNSCEDATQWTTEKAAVHFRTNAGVSH